MTRKMTALIEATCGHVDLGGGGRGGREEDGRCYFIYSLPRRARGRKNGYDAGGGVMTMTTMMTMMTMMLIGLV